MRCNAVGLFPHESYTGLFAGINFISGVRVGTLNLRKDLLYDVGAVAGNNSAEQSDVLENDVDIGGGVRILESLCIPIISYLMSE